MTFKFCRLMLVLAAVMSFPDMMSQNIPRKASLQTALSSYSGGDYERAYEEFTILLQNYTRDPLYKYYSGVCLVRLNRDPVTAAGLLGEAVNDPQEIKAVPPDAWFYLGRAQQMSGRFNEAIGSFDEFSSVAGKKNAREYRVAQYIQECREGRGKTDDRGILHADIAAKEEKAVTRAGKQTEEVGQIASGNKPSAQTEKVPDEYDRILTDGMKFQLKADSLNDVSAEYKKVYEKLPAEQKQDFKQGMIETDSLAARYQRLADQKLGADTNRMSAGQDVVPVVKETVLPVRPAAEPTSHTAGGTPGIKTTGAGRQQTGTDGAVYSRFEILTSAASISGQKIEIDPALPAGLVYRIQMGVFSKPVAPSFFRGIAPVSGFKVPTSGMIRYFAGLFRRMEDADKALLRIKQLGFKDSFLVAVMNSAPVSIERAMLLEKEWGRRPLYEASVTEPDDQQQETGPPTLSYRVEIARAAKPEKEEVVESYRKISGNRGFEILSLVDGTVVYLIGKFITFESASDYAGLLNRNGYLDAKVVAYLGSREIPVETAKQLFEKIE